MTQAVHRDSGSQQPPPPEPLPGGPERLLEPGRRRRLAGVPLGDRRPARARARAERAARPDRQLREALPEGHLCAREHHLGVRESLGRDPRQGAARRAHPCREPTGLRRLQPVPRPRGDARRDSRRHRARGSTLPPPLEESAYGLDDLALLPLTLDEALERFEEDEILARRLPPGVREGVPRAQAPRDREGAGRGSQLRDPASGTTP